MKISIGSPSDYNISGIKKRIEKMNDIMPIPSGYGLDLGTGIGAYFSELNKCTDRLIALDKEFQFLTEFKKLHPNHIDKLIVSSTEDCSIKDDIFDLVFSIEVLDHVDNLYRTMNEIHRILKKNGYLYISVPNKYFPVETHMVNIGPLTMKGKYIPFLSMVNFIHKKIGTARRFSKNDIYNLATQNGFEIIGFKYMMPPFDYWKFGKNMFLRIGSLIEDSFLKIFSMTIIAVLKKT